MSTTTISLLGNGELSKSALVTVQRRLRRTDLDTFALWQAYPWLVTSNDKNVGLPGRKGIVDGIFDVDDVEATVVTLSVRDHTNTAHVATACDHGNDTSVEFDIFGDLASGEIDFDGVIDLDEWVRISYPASDRM